jgi:hypothetical protein
MRSGKWFSRHALIRVAGMSAALAGLASSAGAQVVRGIVEAGSGRGLPGVVVVLLDSAGKRLAGVLVGDDGRYAIRAMAPGRYAVRAERIGYRADAPTPVTLGTGQTVDLRLETQPIPVVLGAVRVTGKSSCVATAAGGSEVSAVWDETRKALFATDLTQQQELFSARVSRFERTLDARSGKITHYETKESSSVTRSPFVSERAAALSANGYVRQSGGDLIYYAPDAAVLLSEEFLADHCFKLREGEGKRAGLIGLAFEPVKGRDKPEIAGTLWIDQKSAELRDLEFAYRQLQNLPRTSKSEDFGGHIEFHRMPTGAWIVERWVIRMPLLVESSALARAPVVIPGAPPSQPDRIQLAGIREAGGEVLESVARGERRELSTEVASVRGVVYDSTRMAPLSGARVFLDGTQFATKSTADGSFLIEKIPPGTYSVSVVHPRFDSLSVAPPIATIELRPNDERMAQLAGPSSATVLARTCRTGAHAEGKAALRGRVRDGMSAAPAIDARVTLSWRGLREPMPGQAAIMDRTLMTQTDSAGRYAFCGLPEGVKITARVVADEKRSKPTDVILPEGELSVLDMVVGTPTVVAAASDAAKLAPVVAVTGPRNRTMTEFERRRRHGNGTFLTRSQIDGLHAERLADLLRTMPGVTVSTNAQGGLVVELRRSASFTMQPVTSGSTRADSSGSSSTGKSTGQASLKRCPAGFLIDGLPVDDAGAADIDVRPELIEAIEAYSGGLVPIEFNSRSGQCGAVLIWTRLFVDRSE